MEELLLVVKEAEKQIRELEERLRLSMLDCEHTESVRDEMEKMVFLAASDVAERGQEAQWISALLRRVREEV
jgi:cell division FtsZ-interacting protein ZapD